MAARRDVGAAGERIAGEYLMLSGYRILERNYRSGHLEVDLIAESRGCLVFIEVKTRRGDSFGDALEAVSVSKLGKIRRAARIYLSERQSRAAYAEYRFDLVAIDMLPGGGGMTLRHVKGIT